MAREPTAQRPERLEDYATFQRDEAGQAPAPYSWGIGPAHGRGTPARGPSAYGGRFEPRRLSTYGGIRRTIRPTVVRPTVVRPTRGHDRPSAFFDVKRRARTRSLGEARRTMAGPRRAPWRFSRQPTRTSRIASALSRLDWSKAGTSGIAKRFGMLPGPSETALDIRDVSPRGGGLALHRGRYTNIPTVERVRR